MNQSPRFRMSIFGALACALALVPASLVTAQEDAQRCEGTVTDAEGNPLANVTISFLQLTKNKLAQPVKTSKKGKYAHSFLAADTSGGYEIKATLEGYKIVKISALTQRGDGTKSTEDTYMVGADQKGLHKVMVPPQSRGDATSKGKCEVDFVMAPDDKFTEAFRKLQAEKLAAEGKAPPSEAAPPAGPGAPAAAAPAPTGGAPAPRDPLDAGKALIAAKDYAGALTPLKEAVASKPDSAEANLWLGEAYLQTDDMANAETTLKKAYELDKAQSRLNFDLGMLYLKKGRMMQAIPYFEGERAINPDSVAVLQNLAKLYYDTEQMPKAVELYEQLISLDTENKTEFYGALADAYKKMGNSAKEAETYQKMGDADPTGMAFYNLGNIMFNKSEMDKAAAAYKKAIEQAPDNADAHYQLGLSYVNLAKFKEAVVELETFAKLKPKDGRAAEARSLAAELKKMGG